MYRVWDFLSSYTWTLATGAVLALVCANLFPDVYSVLTAFPIWFGQTLGQDAGHWLEAHGRLFDIDELGDVARVVTLGSLTNQVFMAAFLFLAGKELWEALILDRGALRGRDALLPGCAGIGGVVVPALIFLGLNTALSTQAGAAWAVPTNTDIAVAYVIGRLAFGPSHPALRFVLLIAIVDDAVAMAVLALFYSDHPLDVFWLLAALASVLAVYGLFNLWPRLWDGSDPMKPVQTRIRLRFGLVPYVLVGGFAFYAVQRSGLNPVLGLLPVIPAIPHADRAFGVFSQAESHLHDLLNRAERMLSYPTGVILFLFAFCNAGVDLSSIGPLTAIVVIALILGKPLGIALGTVVAGRFTGPGLPTKDLLAAGAVASCGFSLSLLFADAAALPTEQTDAIKLGILISLAAVAGVLALIRA